jgi:hypothetical protein
MTTNARDEQLITETSLQEYFQTSISDALENQNVKAEAETIHYVVGLLTSFSRAEKLFERTPDGMTIRPLALLYAEAVEGKTVEERNRSKARRSRNAIGRFAGSVTWPCSSPAYFPKVSIDAS